ncbi:MAG: glycosyltransferase family 1 protein [Pseudomonadota bacterium]
MKIAIVTDAWYPQTNGVVTTLSRTTESLRSLGFCVKLFTPEPFKTIPCPTYPEIRLSLFAGRRLRRALDEFNADSIHIATEGPLGLIARRYCIKRKLKFTTSYHTQFPAYVRKRLPIPERITYRFVRWFHNKAQYTLAPTPAIVDELRSNGFRSPVLWGRGVDTRLFKPSGAARDPRGGPVFMYVGRVAVEKNIEAFLELDLPGQKVVVGDGPALGTLREKFTDCVFTGYKFGEDLAATMASADVFVFPSRTDTFGLVMLEAMACGVPVAAFPVSGPIDVVKNGVTGVLDNCLRRACLEALHIDRHACRHHALANSWERCTNEFLSHLSNTKDGLPSPSTFVASVTPTPASVAQHRPIPQPETQHPQPPLMD